jgi:hypothetical protein
MAYPKVLAHWGTLKPMVGGFGTFSQIGLHGEMHFAALILIGSDQAASLMNVAMLLSIIVLLNGCAKIETAPTYRPWILLILVLTSSAVTSLVAGGKVDLFGAAMGVAACCIVLNDLYRLDSKAASPLLAGLFAGFAIIAKLSLLATLVPMLALLVLWGGLYHRRILCSVYWRNVGVMVLAGVVACIPHMVKNQLLFGEPLAPVISSASWLQQEWYTPTQQATLWAVYPLAAFLGALPGMGGAMSAGILALWPVVLLTGRARGRRILTSRSFQAAIVSVVALVIWVVLRPGVFALRYFLPPLLLLAVLPAVETDRLLRDLKTLRALKAAIWLVLAMALAASFNRPEGHPGEAWDYLRGKLSAVEFADAPGRAAAVLTAHADPSERVWLASPYAYFLRAESLANASGRDDYRHVSAHPAQAGWTYLYRQGFRYIYVGPLGGSIGRGGSTLTLGWRLGQSSLDSTDLPDDLQLVAMDLQSVAGEPITPGSRDYPAYGVFRLERTGPEEKNENSALNLDANR